MPAQKYTCRSGVNYKTHILLLDSEGFATSLVYTGLNAASPPFWVVLLRLCTLAVRNAGGKKNMITPDTDGLMDGSLVIRLELQKRILPGPIDVMFWGGNIWDCESCFIKGSERMYSHLSEKASSSIRSNNCRRNEIRRPFCNINDVHVGMRSRPDDFSHRWSLLVDAEAWTRLFYKLTSIYLILLIIIISILL